MKKEHLIFGEDIEDLKNLVEIKKEVITIITREKLCKEIIQRSLQEIIEEKVHLKMHLTIKEKGDR
jgi:ethanolamine utilization protein EutQ (cupin superfamily)